MFNGQIFVVVLLAAIFLLILVVGLVRHSRKHEAGGTIAPYSELKRQIKEGTAVPFPVAKGAAKLSPLPWEQILQIADPDTRYLEMLTFVTAKELEQGYDVLSENERIVKHVCLLESEVNNGGFDQYFFNSAGNYALQTMDLLRRIGSKGTLALLTQAIEAFGLNPPSSDRETRWAQMDMLPEAASDEWDRLNREFYNSTESLADLVVNYIGEQA